MLRKVDGGGYGERLDALRKELTRRRLDGFVVPLTDEHMSEYVGAYAHRLAWLTGFGGSAGSAVVLRDQAALFVDGRYTLQVRQQVDERHYSFHNVPQESLAKWLGEQVGKGARIGYDPWFHAKSWVEAARAELISKGAELVAVESNPVDTVWQDRPVPSRAQAIVHPDALAGQSSADKRKAVAQWLSKQGLDAVVLSALDSIAWTFNIRGEDVARTPVVLAYAVIQADGTADLFIAPEKIADAVKKHLGPQVRLQPRDGFVAYLRTLAGKRVAVDPERAVSAILEVLEGAGAKLTLARDPVVLPKALKNAVEIAGHRAAQARDGAALSRFLHWLSVNAGSGQLTEISASDQLQRFREETGQLRDLSFDTISGAGPNGAVVHYRASEETARRIEPGTLYLVDSGGQYPDGTTDVTRTVAIGLPTAEMRDRFTRVLKGHIALARAVFPVGTKGGQLDTLARQALWNAGLDYAHGTGHGVGSYLAVHEGPQRIGHTGDTSEPLAPGMIISNEPGYYKAGEYGIRIENLVLVVERSLPGAERPMLGFETLTFAPIDRVLIDVDSLTADECAWVDDYHASVRQIVAPQLQGEARDWLVNVTRPVREGA